ncbi:cytochrome ubiquinol oxidase subunit II, partial [Methylobacterium frigidaeris]
DEGGFSAWVDKVKQEGGGLTRADYLKLERPSEKEPVRYYKTVDADLYDAILNMCVDRAKMCMHDMAAIDARGGGGREGLHSVMSLTYDKAVRRGTGATQQATFVTALCTPADAYGLGNASKTSAASPATPRLN